ncbi:MAG: hypothetical protein K940chlam7_00450 [Chlamydiae bacterium]|nr:hypothetical protein [Chlamydiota bacterium]
MLRFYKFEIKTRKKQGKFGPLKKFGVWVSIKRELQNYGKITKKRSAIVLQLPLKIIDNITNVKYTNVYKVSNGYDCA